MPKRLAMPAALFVAGVLLLAILPLATASAAEPWWQVLPGSRPTYLWEPTDSVQEVEIELANNPTFGPGAAIAVHVGGKTVGCLGSGFLGNFCPFGTGFPPEHTALELEATLEAALESSAVEVSGGPVGVEAFTITTPPGPTVSFSPVLSGVTGNAKIKVLSPGGSGRLVLTITNLGDAAVDGTGSPVTVVDHLPEGVVADGAEGFAGGHGPIECTTEAPQQVSCTFEGILPPYEGLEIEIPASLTGSPPVAGAPGEVVVSGGNARPAGAVQSIKVGPGPTPFGVEVFSAQAEEEGGAPAAQAGGHPFQFTTTIGVNSGAVNPDPARGGRFVSFEHRALVRNLRSTLPAGLVGNATVMPTCDMSTFLTVVDVGFFGNACPDSAAIGVASVTAIEPGYFGLLRLAVPVFNLPPAPGEPARFGIMAVGIPAVIDTEVDPEDEYRIRATVRNLTQVGMILDSTVSFWGVPGDPRHDNSRGWSCVGQMPPCARPSDRGEEAFLRNPVSCGTALHFGLQIEPWNTPLGTQVASARSEGEPLRGCNQVPFDPSVAAAPTNRSAGASSGLSFELNMPNSGLLNPKALAAEGQAKKVEVTLPEGVTVNPSEANGLGACTPADYAQERFDSAPGEGCPETSKIGSIDITTPLLEEEAHGSVYVAAPSDNPFGSLLALYVVAKIPDRGILVKQAGKVELNPVTGQLVSTFDDLPQIPFSSFKLHFKEGDRAPLVMPSSCGSYDIVTNFTPWSAADPDNPQPNEIVTRTSSFTVDHGPNGSDCPSGTPPFHPGFTAGTENNAAGSYSPFKARLTRNDGEQEFSRFSLKLPRGVIGNLSGIPFCSEAAIAQARARTGANGGQEELESPSCPAASQIGHTLVGAGVGSALTYVPGNLYLAGPYQGAKLSAVAITPAKIGPFDLGDVVIRQALKVDPVTAEVSTDGSSSDPIPHILQGIVVHARDIRVLVDRKDFVLNPTNCDRMTASASVSGLAAVDVSSPFQAADCASLGFKPKLALSLQGGTRRASHPRLKAVLTARKGDANIRKAVVALPHSEFLEQSHIRTICTRVQFNAGGGNGEQCPKGSIYGWVKAVTPLLGEPLSGPVYLRSSNHPLPDLVAALHSGKVDIDLAGRIDSVNGGIRNSFEAVPDAPVTKFTLEMQGGKKGLLVNSTNICRGKHRASATFTGQNGKRLESHPLLKAKCGGKKKHKKH